jgi:hypothetical protein
MWELYEACISIAVFPATVFLGLLLLWSLVTIVLGVGSDFSLGDWLHLPHHPGMGPDHDGIWHSVQQHAGEAMGAVVLAPARWLNLKDLPIVVWGGVFTLVWWSVSILNWFVCDSLFLGKEPGIWVSCLLLLRNVAISLVVTKLVTQPMRDWFVNHELGSRDLVGEEVEIWSWDASPSHGQARFKTDSAPLLLNIHTDGPVLPKGTRAWITHYDPKKRIYIVSATTTSKSISSG